LKINMHSEEEKTTATTCDDPDTITVVYADGRTEVKPASKEPDPFMEQIIAARKRRPSWLGRNGWGV